MASNLRLLALIITIAYTFIVGPTRALASSSQQRLAWLHLPRRQLQLRPARRRRAAPDQAGVRIARFAHKLLGVPYSWGGDSPRSGFDCSGLVRFVYSHFGVRLPHSSYADAALGVMVPRRALRPGDLVFFDGDSHVGIYIGKNRFIHAPHSGSPVQITNLSSSWYGETYDGARQVVSRAGRLLRAL